MKLNMSWRHGPESLMLWQIARRLVVSGSIVFVAYVLYRMMLPR
jgi:hypothetical protein